MVGGSAPSSPTGQSDSGYLSSPKKSLSPQARKGIDVQDFEKKHVMEESGSAYRQPAASGTEGSKQTEKGKDESIRNQVGIYGASHNGLPSETGLVSTNFGSFHDLAESRNNEVNQAKYANSDNRYKQRDFTLGQTRASDNKFSTQSAPGKRIDLVKYMRNQHMRSKYSAQGQSSLNRVEGQSRELEQEKYAKVNNGSNVSDFLPAQLHSYGNENSAQSAHGNSLGLTTYTSSGVMGNKTSILDQSSQCPASGPREKTPSSYEAQNKLHMDAIEVNVDFNSTKLAGGELRQYPSISNHQASITFCELTPCPEGQLMDYSGESFRNELQQRDLADAYNNMTNANATEGKGREPPNPTKQDFEGKVTASKVVTPTPQIGGASPADLGEPNPNFEVMIQSMKRSFECLQPPDNKMQRRQLRRLYQLTANSLRLLGVLKEDGPN